MEHPIRLALFSRDEADSVLIEPIGDGVGFNVGDEAPLSVVPIKEALDGVVMLLVAAVFGGESGLGISLHSADGMEPDVAT